MLAAIRTRLFGSETMTPKARAFHLLKLSGPLLFSVASAFVLLAKIPYGFETNDQFQYLLLPYRSIYTPFLTDDWFTWQTSHYHYSFSVFIRMLHGLFGESGFPLSVFAAHLAVLALLGYALLRTARAAGVHWTAAAFAVLCVAFVRRMGLAGAVVNHGVLLPADMALPFLLLGFASWVEKTPLKAGLFLGAAGLLHANYAVLGPLILAVPELLRLRAERTLRPSLLLAGGYALLAWPSLIAAIVGFFAADSAPEAMKILFEFRSPHHYRPELFNSPDILWPAILLLLAAPAWVGLYRSGNRRMLGVVAALFISQLVAMAATEWMDGGLLIRLFLWRMSVPLILISAVGAGAIFAHAVQRPLSAAPVMAAVTLFTVLSFAEGGPVFDRHHRVDVNRISRTLAKTHLPSSNRIRGTRTPLSLYTWIQRHTPDSAIFLVPPGLDDFRLQARRGIFVDWKCCPMKGDEIAEWARRMTAAMGTAELKDKGYALHRAAHRRYLSRSLSALEKLAREEGIRYILARPHKKPPKGLKKLVTKSGWSVYRVR